MKFDEVVRKGEELPRQKYAIESVAKRSVVEEGFTIHDGCVLVLTGIVITSFVVLGQVFDAVLPALNA